MFGHALQGGEFHLLAIAVGGAHQGHRRLGVAMAQKQLTGLLYLLRPTAALGVIEGGDKIGLGRGLQTPSDDRPGGEQIRERDGAEVMSQGRPHQGGTAAQCRDPGDHLHLGARLWAPTLGKQVFIQGAGHAEDPCIAGGDQGHGATGFGHGIGLHTAVYLFGHAFAHNLLAGDQVFDQANIGLVADNHIGCGDGLAGAGGHLPCVPRAYAHQIDLAGCCITHLRYSN